MLQADFDTENDNETIRDNRERVRQCEMLGEYALAEHIRDIPVNEQVHQIALASALGKNVPDVTTPEQRARCPPRSSWMRSSREDAPDRVLLLDAGHSHIQSLRLEGQPPVVDAQAVQDRRVHGVDMHRVFDDVVAEIVGLAVADAALDAAAGHPDGEAARMVIAAVVLRVRPPWQ